MPKGLVIALFGSLFMFLMVFSTAACATHLGKTKTVDGVAIYLGMVPAAVMRQNPDINPAHEPSKIPSSKHVHHVMLALFDGPGGARITDAIVTARVAPHLTMSSTDDDGLYVLRRR